MGRSAKDPDASASAPERRSLRNSKPLEEEVKSNSLSKGRRSVSKKKEDKIDKKTEEKVDNKNEEDGPEEVGESSEDKNHQSTSEVGGETSNPKPVGRRSGRKRQLSEGADLEEDSLNKTDEKADDANNEEEDEKEGEKEGEKDENEGKDRSELKNGKAEGSAKGKAKKKRKPPTKKKKEEHDESEMWTPLEPLDGDEKKDAQKKTQSKSDRRKQALVERQAPAEPMLQKQRPPRQRRNSDASECEVLGSVHRTIRRPKPIVTVDIDDEASETGSIQIVAEPDVDSVFDFKRLLIQYRNVNLPSSLWGVHKDPRNLFVSFTRFNPDYPEMNGVMADRAVVFKGSLHPEVFVNGEKLELPEMFNVVETIFEAAQVIEFVNNTVAPPVSHQPDAASDEVCSL